jgi:hypothetical protein
MLSTDLPPTRVVVLDALLPHKTERNPRWQSFIIGGRWSHRMLCTENGPTDSCQREYVDLDMTRKLRRGLLVRNYEQARRDVERSGVRGSATVILYGVDPEKESLDDYIRRLEADHPCQTYAFLRAGGPWLDQLDTAGFTRMFDSIASSEWITIVDCWVERAPLRVVGK